LIVVSVRGTGAEAATDRQLIQSPETYIGYGRARNFANAGGVVKDQSNTYSIPSVPQLNKWGLSGVWTVGDEQAVLDSTPGRIVFRFHARDLHLVLGPSSDGRPVRFRVLLDGKVPGENRGVDVDAQGNGTVSGQRLYQLIRQNGPVQDRTFEIEFEDPGVQAFAFTFG
jgi:hypothetical protein